MSIREKINCDDCAPEFGCWAGNEACRKKPLNLNAGSPGAAGSALVEEMRRLRSMPGNCALANELIDRAIAVQLEAEARVFLEVHPQLTKEAPCPDCYGGHFKPCNICGDSGVALIVLPLETPMNGSSPTGDAP